MNVRPLITVLVPTFNDEALLVECLDSLKRQTYDNFEVIIVDDASTNSTGRLAKDYSTSDSRFKYFRNSANLGMTKNWNRALSEATGRFVMKLDGDDQFQKDTIGLMIDAAERRSAKIVFCRTIDCDENLNPLSPYRGELAFRKARLSTELEHYQNGHFWYRMCFDDYQLWHSNAFLVETELLRKLNGWDVRWGCASDTDLILRLMETNLPVVSIPHVGVHYRHRKGSVSDLFRKKNLLGLEGSVLSLLSLDRYIKRGGKVDRNMEFNWYRIWSNWIDSRKFAKDNRDDFAALTAYQIDCRPPICRIRVEQFCRRTVSNFIRSIWSKRTISYVNEAGATYRAHDSNSVAVPKSQDTT